MCVCIILFYLYLASVGLHAAGLQALCLPSFKTEEGAWSQQQRHQCIFCFCIYLFCFNILFYIGEQLINNVVLVSGVQQSDSVIYIQVSILFQILLPFRLLCNIEQSSLCCIVGLCWLPILFYFISFF